MTGRFTASDILPACAEAITEMPQVLASSMAFASSGLPISSVISTDGDNERIAIVIPMAFGQLSKQSQRIPIVFCGIPL